MRPVQYLLLVEIQLSSRAEIGYLNMHSSSKLMMLMMWNHGLLTSPTARLKDTNSLLSEYAKIQVSASLTPANELFVIIDTRIKLS